MRLLHTSTLRVVEINEPNPNYAILSHTIRQWDSHEISFQQIQSPNFRDLKGFNKIRNATTLARVNGFQYLWIDTCNIDKKSSAELSEAINSMYTWYKQAQACYVYLSDMDGEDLNAHNCRWFSRGWTLQELLAPSTVFFYNRKWKFIGSKASLRKKISERTGIPYSVLLGYGDNDVSIADKMKWAAGRETTRPEDLAYCLMGLFDVNMPIIYGEGKKAFHRLQQEIIRSSSDHTIFAWISADDDSLGAHDLLATDASDFLRFSTRPPSSVWMGLENTHDDQYVRNGRFLAIGDPNTADPLSDLVIKRSADLGFFSDVNLMQNPCISYPEPMVTTPGGFGFHAKYGPYDSIGADGKLNSLSQPKVIGLAYHHVDPDDSHIWQFFIVVVGFGRGSPWCDIRPFRGYPARNEKSHVDFYTSEVVVALREYDNHALVAGLLQTDELSDRVTKQMGLVHTVKTTSFSIGSFSILSRSLRPGRSNDTRGLVSNHSRFSSDSERPPTISSIDEAALRRAVKRRQILDEIISTEESYIADLRALVYLMSTILASGTSLPNGVRASVQQNVFDLLHLHETILEKCHRAALKSAARRWADTLSYRRLRSPRRFRRLESVVDDETTQAQCPGRSSMDSSDFTKTRARDGAETADISDLVRPFSSLVTSFLSYEEYTANHGLVAHDLQRHLPALWSSYGAGMESLARSVVSLDRRKSDSKKGLTQFRSLVEVVNEATNAPEARLHIQRRWLLQSRLHFGISGLQHEEFRNLGNIILCGVLHIAYQTKLRVEGTYALCVLYQAHFLVAFPAETPCKFEIVALIKLCDLKIESPMDGKGLQCPSALYTWKICFSVGGSLYELVLSACSSTEEEQWTKGLCGELSTSLKAESQTANPATILTLELKSVGTIYNHQGPLARRLSIQRAATVGNRASICQVIVRNTNSPEELHDFRPPWTSAINRSQSHLSTNRIVVLAPKRSERVRLEATLGDVWTKEKLPYPGMAASRGGQIIRASAGSLVRKLSFASIHAPFSRRSASLTLTSRKSSEALSGTRRSRDRIPTFSIRRDSFDEKSQQPRTKRGPEDFRELDTMDSVIHRMIGDHNDPPVTGEAGSEAKEVRTKKSVTVTLLPICPDDPADIFYRDQGEEVQEDCNAKTVQGVEKKRRWSNPISRFKGPLKEGLRGLVYSNK
ncbi:hypothetical protein DV738_g3924, partial [Chaetothyriales sp. CBS 135597]